MASLHKHGTSEEGVAAGWARVPRQTALAQLVRILDSPHFRTSKRSSLFLRFVVEHAIDNDLDCLKERTLGIEVFDRDPQYDTNQDPIVRSTAGEVRKRLAQYYLEPEHQGELRITMPTGSYLPEVHADPGTPLQLPNARHTASIPVRKLLWIAGSAILVVVAAVTVRPAFQKTDLDRFWEPVISAPGPVLVCLAQPKAYNFNAPTQRALDLWFQHPDEKAGPPALIATVPLSEFVSMWDRYTGLGDAQTLSRVSSLFGEHRKPIQLRGGTSVSLADLRGNPSVLIGAFSNEWTLNLTGELRFYFVDDGNGTASVQDRNNPGQNGWKVVNAWPHWKIQEDYAIVTRVVNPTTEQTVVVAAGITHYGTQAAGEFLTKPEYFAEALKHAPRDWSRKNLQVVISTKVLAGTVGPPIPVAVHSW